MKGKMFLLHELNWQIVILDFALIAAWSWLGFVYITNQRPMRGACLLLAALSIICLTIGDIGTAMGYSGRGIWYFERWFRGIPWRLTAVITFTVQGILIKKKSF